MARKQRKLIDQIRRAASKCGIYQDVLARAAGLDKAGLTRFVTGKLGLSMKALDGLAVLLGLEIRRTGK